MQRELTLPSSQGMLARVRHALESVPYAWIALPLRLAVATIFWRSALVKVANVDAALALFTDEYRVPLLPPGFAMYCALAIELVTPVLLVLGLATRAAAAVLLVMTAVIEIFVYPNAWPTHLQWTAMLVVLLCRGAGRYSIDARISRF